MKGNRVLKLLSYFLIPILVAVVIISVFYELRKEEYNAEEYFSSSEFAFDYMMNIESSMRALIYTDTEELHGEFINEEKDIIYEDSNYTKLDKNNYLIIYKDKAITNVYEESLGNNIDKIKEYINSQEAGYRKLRVISGKAQGNSEILSKEGMSYLKNYGINYYKTITEVPVYFTAQLEDFEIYIAYEEDFNHNTVEYKLMNMAKTILPFENSIYIILPICSVLILMLMVYLIISIGHTKGKKGIELNDLDKIPLEIILLVAFAIIMLLVIIFIEIDGLGENLFNFIISVMISAYLLGSYVFAITINTIIKRIKAKTLVQTSWCLRICRWILNLIKRIKNKIKEIFDIFKYSKNITFKVIVYVELIIIISIIIFAIFQLIGGIFIELIFLGYIVYGIIKEIVCLSKIENKLKEMYEGNNKTKLEEKDFTPISVNAVRYINDVSNGFENAIQEGIKSERLKTELITNVSHDIKTPLTSIINYVDLLKQENIDNEKAKEYIGILDKKSQRLKKLTEDLIEASKVSSGNVKLNVEILNICELIKQTTGEFEDKFREKGLEVIKTIPNEQIYIKADNRYMYRIIENLFSNISKYALDNSRVYIDIKTINNKVKIEMKNISKDKLNITAEELMQRFVRGDKSRTTEGSGLGISISKSLTELQGGEFKMDVDGDLFKIELVFTKLTK